MDEFTPIIKPQRKRNNRSLFLAKFILSVILLNIFYLGNVKAQQHAILDSMIRVLEAKSIYRDRVNWKTLKKTLNNSLDNSKTDPIEQAFPAIQKLYTELGDRHGQFIAEGKTIRSSSGTKKRSVDSMLYQYALDEKYAFRTTVIDGKYGYFVLPSAQIDLDGSKDSTGAVERISQMAQQLQDSLCSLNKSGIEGVIIDLRLCLGGTTWIHLGGLIPLFGEGPIFSIQLVGQKDKQIKAVKGDIYEENSKLAGTQANCTFNRKKVVVLLGPLTASAGEQTAVALRKLNNVKFVGERTAGYLTMTQLKHLGNDVFFSYTAGYVKDNMGQIYRDDFVPDIEVLGGDNFQSLKDDLKIKAAIKWMEN